uniref:(northern house mosquito) hypothetical protein n=1 Tax=Culex pipiens TaxID=7175 RepID=A0A8D8DL32_CULPI
MPSGHVWIYVWVLIPVPVRYLSGFRCPTRSHQHDTDDSHPEAGWPGVRGQRGLHQIPGRRSCQKRRRLTNHCGTAKRKRESALETRPAECLPLLLQLRWHTHGPLLYVQNLPRCPVPAVQLKSRLYWSYCRKA